MPVAEHLPSSHLLLVVAICVLSAAPVRSPSPQGREGVDWVSHRVDMISLPLSQRDGAKAHVPLFSTAGIAAPLLIFPGRLFVWLYRQLFFTYPHLRTSLASSFVKNAIFCQPWPPWLNACEVSVAALHQLSRLLKQNCLWSHDAFEGCQL